MEQSNPLSVITETSKAKKPKPASKKKRPQDRRSALLRKRLTTRQGLQELKQQVPGWVTSLTLHSAVLFLLAYISLPLSKPPELSLRATQVVEESFEEESILDLDLEIEQESLDESIEQDQEEAHVEIPTEVFDMADITPLETVDEVVDFESAIDNLSEVSISSGMTSMGLEGRTSAGKASLLRSGGGTKSSEKAVLAGLDWLARHQYSDGSWNFDHTQSECDGRCGNPGSARQARAGATGLALLAYLGAGHTQTEGRYQRVVLQGIYALGNMMKLDKNGGSFYEPIGRMYSHGIATMALCEAYALTGDPALRDPAQAAINYVCYAQDPNGGGWRYTPQQPGDTSVVGWQIGALKSGYLSNLYVPPLVVKRAEGFLDTMSFEDNSRYKYNLDPDHANSAAVTAIGLLCRMYMGATRDDPGMEAGIAYLSKQGPSTQNAYHNYYAAQVLFHYTGGKGPIWKEWNNETRELLVATQIQEGHEAGSWNPAPSEDYGRDRGGRLYTTALSTMTLEVYYRMLPIYRKDAVAGEFEFED